jgi:hypothetical protein
MMLHLLFLRSSTNTEPVQRADYRVHPLHMYPKSEFNLVTTRIEREHSKCVANP